MTSLALANARRNWRRYHLPMETLRILMATRAPLSHSLPQAHYVGTAYISCKMPTPHPTKVLEY